MAAPLVVGNEEHRFLVLDQLREIERRARRRAAGADGPQHRAGRDAGRAAGAWQAGADPVLVVTPADQTVTDAAAFTAALRARRARRRPTAPSSSSASRPTAPETGYGYIRAEGGAAAVAQFVEKPDLATAEQYLAAAATSGTPACSC